MLLDIGLGILSAIALSRTTSLSLGPWTIIFAALFALLPDLDFFIHLVARKKIDELSHEHRDLLHNPLLFIPSGFIILAFLNIDFAYLFVLCSLAHFLHDSMGIGWGIRWAYPISKKYYKFFSDKKGRFAANLLVLWTPEEQREASMQFGNPHWVADYLKFGPDLIVEILVFAIALFALLRFWPQ